MDLVTTFRKPLMAAKRSSTFGNTYERMKDLYIQYGNHGRSKIDVLSTFPLFTPNSGGTYAQRAPLSIQAINDLVPGLLAFSESLGRERTPIITVDDYAERNGRGKADELAALFTKHGSDKATTHAYYKVYASVLAKGASDILEVGLGTNMPDVVSNMGIAGRPGASLRAFRDFCPTASVYGADVDRRVLFSEDRIKTFHVDQTDRNSFVLLGKFLPDEFDLLIDDGLHLPNANINSLGFFLTKVKAGGFAIVEDIPFAASDFWHLVSQMLPERFKGSLVRSTSSLMFVVERLS